MEEASNGPTFYDAYLRDGKDTMYPIPVLVLGPTDSEKEAMKSFSTKLVRRIFLVDAMSGKDERAQEVSILRYAEEISLVVQLRKDGRIYPPRLIVRYVFAQLSRVTGNMK